jgi:hypothetical protein
VKSRRDKLGRPAKLLTEQQIRQAIKNTGSNQAAARYLNVSFPTYALYAKMYLDQETGKTLLELHKNQSGEGIPKFHKSAKEPRIEDLLKAGMSIQSYSVEKLKARLLYEGYLAPQCNKCGFHEARVLDLKIPLILSFKDGNRSNWVVENLEMLCYNCYFLYVGDLFTKKQVQYLEDANTPIVQPSQTDWELDEYYRQHFEELGLISKASDDSSEYIDQI